MSEVNLSRYIWALFWGYWILSAAYTRSKVKKVSSGQKSIQWIFHLIFVILAFSITLYEFKNLTFWREIIPHNLIVEYLGVIILLISLSFAIWARISLGRNWSGAIQMVEGQRLVRNGPYKYIRNPIYTGIVCGFFGTFITFGTTASLVGFIIILSTYIVKIDKEQRYLIEEFGEEYKKYISESWALIPFIF
jgi:protein-S-isoprenylcysteine O-methyltransferase Ste14